jgi:hypothetical protein
MRQDPPTWGWHDNANVGLARQRQRGAGTTTPTWGWHDIDPHREETKCLSLGSWVYANGTTTPTWGWHDIDPHREETKCLSLGSWVYANGATMPTWGWHDNANVGLARQERCRHGGPLAYLTRSRTIRLNIDSCCSRA